jgi:signal transduction histidine kinase
MGQAGRMADEASNRLAVIRRVTARPVVTDLAVVLVTLSLGLGHDHWARATEHHQWSWLFDLALVVPLLWRRHHPTRVFLVIAAIALAQWLSGTLAGADFAVLVALYAVGLYERRPLAIATAAGIAEIGVVMASASWAPRGTQVTSGLLLTGTVTAAWVLGVYVRTRRAYIRSVLERAATAERERDHEAIIATASERARISREMHDIVAHSLSVMIALSDGAAAAAIREPTAAQKTMEQASALGRQALGEVRRLLGSLHESGDEDADRFELAPQPGLAELDDLVARVRSAGLAVELVVVGQALILPPAAQLAVYRTVQEALTNVLKHARSPTRATVTLTYGSAGIDIEVENDDAEPGRGRRAVVSPADTVGQGLAGMRARAAVFDGSLHAGHRDEGGWRVVSHLSFEEAAGR